MYSALLLSDGLSAGRPCEGRCRIISSLRQRQFLPEQQPIPRAVSTKRAGPDSSHPEAALHAGPHPLSRVWVPPPRLVSLSSETPAPAGHHFLLSDRIPGLSSEVLET